MQGSATLAMAYAGARFANSLLHAMKGHADIVECTFVECDVAETPFFASPVLLGVSNLAVVYRSTLHKSENLTLSNFSA